MASDVLLSSIHFLKATLIQTEWHPHKYCTQNPSWQVFLHIFTQTCKWAHFIGWWPVEIEQPANSHAEFNKMQAQREWSVCVWCVSLYLLVVSNKDEVLACLAQCGDGVGLENLCSLFYNHQTWTHFLQKCAELGCPGRCHANNLMDSLSIYLHITSAIFMITYITTSSYINDLETNFMSAQ